MKTILIFFMLGILTGITHAQSKSDKMYDTFAGNEGITSFTFTKNMFDAFNINLGDDGSEKNVTGDLHRIRFMSYNPEKGDLSGYAFLKKAIGCLPKVSYKKYEGTDEDDDAEIWLLGGKTRFSECHIFVKNETDNQLQFVVSFYGDFVVNDLEKLKKTGRNFSEKGNK